MARATMGRLRSGVGINPPILNLAPPRQAPTITSTNAISRTSAQKLAHTLTADVPASWSITGGAQAAEFEINAGNVLRFAGDGTEEAGAHVVIVTATYAGRSTNQTITVTVT